MQQQTPAQRQRQRHRMISDLGGAVIRHIQHHDPPFRRRDAIDVVVPHAHPAHGAQPRKPLQVIGIDLVAQDHQPFGRGTVLIGQISQRARRLGKDDPDVGTVDSPLDAVVGV